MTRGWTYNVSSATSERKWFNPHHILVPVPSKDLDFQCHMSWSFLHSAIMSPVKMRGDCLFC